MSTTIITDLKHHREENPHNTDKHRYQPTRTQPMQSNQPSPPAARRQLNLCKTTTLKKTENCTGFQDQLSLNASQKYCRMLQGEHSAILSTFINTPVTHTLTDPADGT